MTQTLRAADGTRLELEFFPLPPAPRGCVLIVHGLGEHCRRYAALAADLTASGWQVVSYDLRGHGRSEGPRGALRQPDDLLRDLGTVIDAVRSATPAPLFLLGHSLGGVVAARFVAEGLGPQPAPWFRSLDGLVLSSPALDPGMNIGQKLLLAVLGPLAPNLAVHNGLRPEWICRDPAVVRAYRDDPLVHYRVTPSLVRFLLDAGAEILQRAAQWAVPTLLLYAGSDRCVSPRGSAAFAAAAPEMVVRTQAFPALFHEIFNEPERGEVIAVLRDWLERESSVS